MLATTVDAHELSVAANEAGVSTVLACIHLTGQRRCGITEAVAKELI